MSSEGSLRGAAITGASWLFIQTLAARAVGALTFVVLARLLVPKEFGLVALAAVFIALAGVFVEQGFGQALVQRETLEPEHLNTAFWLGVGTSAALAGVLVGGAGVASRAFAEPELAPVLRVMALSLVISSLSSVPRSVLQRALKFKWVATRQLIGTVAGAVAGVGFALAGYGVWSLVAQLLASSTAVTATVWTGSPWKPGLAMSRRHFRDLFGFSSAVLGINVANFVSRRADDFLIGAFLGPVALGLYAVAYRVLLIMTEVLLRTVEGVTFPVLSRLGSDLDRTRRAYYMITQASAAITMPAFLGVAVLAPQIVEVLFGSKWTASAPVLSVLSLTGITLGIFYFNGSVFKALGRPGHALQQAVVNGAASVLGFTIAAQYGILAVAIAYALRSYLLSPYTIFMMKRVLGFPVGAYLLQFAAPAASALLMCAAMIVSRAYLDAVLDGAVLLVVLIAIGGAAYGALLRLTAPALARTLISTVATAAGPLGRRVRR